MKEEEKRKIGKFLSLILRHNPGIIGISLDDQGWANVEELIGRCARKGTHFTMKQLEEIVATNDKQRYAFNENKTRIRANQGHSIGIDLALKPVVPPEQLYHGTASYNYDVIMQEGIKKMNRQHVHLSGDKDTAWKVGSRHGKPVIFVVQTGQMHREGILFYQADNGVWLTDYVDSRYITLTEEQKNIK